MNEIEKHVTSLELSRRLKGLGCPQRSYFDWVKENGELTIWNPTQVSDYVTGNQEFLCSAYLSSELGEWLSDSFFVPLPAYPEGSRGKRIWMTNKIELMLGVKRKKLASITSEADTEVDCRAKTLIWLIEKGIIKFGEPLTHKTLEIEENGKKYRYNRGGFEPVN